MAQETNSYTFESKTIDELQELGKLSGSEKTIISTNNDTKKVSIDTIVGYATNLIAQQMGGQSASVTSLPVIVNPSDGKCIVVVPEGESIPANQRTPGTIYFEKEKQTSIRTKINIPTSVTVSSTLGLRRI